MTKARRRHAIRLTTVVVLVGLFSSCAPASTGPTATQSDQEETTMTTVTDAVAASDPRVADVLTVKVTESGMARVMSIAVSISGDEPVSTETVVNIAVAALQNAKSDIDDLKILARSAADTDVILDLSPAGEGLPADVEWVWLSSSLQLIGADLSELSAG
ncbi:MULTISPECIES: hypothetical protein [unclassified Microbacterium]|uniref:hypothetical protein n=1 Tax=unclassified Microbacterium TaxID=2609290 RepID=UPI00214C975D|nr:MULTISPECIES: hypothetical protein [unclassified Microbacterium]MCR2801441.1 hypothetical protein [Microbacterium sp. zg.Y818]MCR2826473.1 hypothetical protein [Microbacterium sp. zg.Y909]WIM21261.1 hypothetical protein QNO21_08995 [Microbacterium sp. zg-Y818]